MIALGYLLAGIAIYIVGGLLTVWVCGRFNWVRIKDANSVFWWWPAMLILMGLAALAIGVEQTNKRTAKIVNRIYQAGTRDKSQFDNKE